MENLINIWQSNESFRVIVLTLFPCIIFYILYKLFCWTKDERFDEKEAFMAAALLTPVTMFIIGGLFILLLTVIYNL